MLRALKSMPQALSTLRVLAGVETGVQFCCFWVVQVPECHVVKGPQQNCVSEKGSHHEARVTSRDLEENKMPPSI